jgi:hypothetical protein
LGFLKQQDLVSHDLVNARHDGHSRLFERMQVVTRKPAGEKFARLSNCLSHEQKLYHGLVKPQKPTATPRSYGQYWGRTSPARPDARSMTAAVYDPIAGLQKFGYTERKAAFLYLVGMHSGSFLRRQLLTFIER